MRHPLLFRLFSSFTATIRTLNDPQSRQVLVVAHRADWRRESFGSRRGIKSATALGAF